MKNAYWKAFRELQINRTITQETREELEKIDEELKKDPDYNPNICPRCLKRPIELPSLSVHDNETEICCICRLEENLVNQAKCYGLKITPDIIEREKRIPLRKSGHWFLYHEAVRPLWLEDELLLLAKQRRRLALKKNWQCMTTAKVAAHSI